MDKNIVHEIGNFLQQIISNAEYISQNSAMAEYAQKIQNSAYKIDALLTDTTVKKPVIDIKKRVIKGFDFSYFNGKKILIVDDIEENIFIMENIFKTLSCDIKSVKSGEEALSIYKNGFRPDIICMDMIMPGIDGFTTTQALKKQGCVAYIIAVSALKNQSQEVVSLFDVWLPKPFTKEHIIGALTGYYGDNGVQKRVKVYKLGVDISDKEKVRILELANNGAYSELLRLIQELPESTSKSFLERALKELSFREIIESIDI